VKLQEYLEKESLPMSKFSEVTGIKQDTLNKYKYGLRIPNRRNMDIIYQATKGEITADDFYATADNLSVTLSSRR
tara:strand:- start:21718 stop:21942 length:225 start_codon:yes stop_codon:yes gene_type:complete